MQQMLQPVAAYSFLLKWRPQKEHLVASVRPLVWLVQLLSEEPTAGFKPSCRVISTCVETETSINHTERII